MGAAGSPNREKDASASAREGEQMSLGWISRKSQTINIKKIPRV